ncbi:MAG TPA: hypothetical protein VGC56_06050 [Allosphingosinicella sp.]|jgi:hypothetical protein
MEQIATTGFDIADHVFHAGVDEHGRMVFSNGVSRSRLPDFFARRPHYPEALEACSGPHHWDGSFRGWGTRCG